MAPSPRLSARSFRLFTLPLSFFALACDDGETGVAPTTGELPPYGESQCGRYSQIELTGKYMVQNNLWNDEAATQEQCVTALWDGSSQTAGFVVSPISVGLDGPTPASYPSIVCGWHFGTFHGAYREARALDAITTVPTSWDFTAPDTGRFDVSYDLWLHPEGNPGDPAGGLEIMIWLYHREVTPFGVNVGSIVIAGAAWEIWFGENAGWNTLSYRRVESTSSAELDLREFMSHALEQGHAQGSWLLLSVQAGIEIWECRAPFTTHRYSVEIR